MFLMTIDTNLLLKNDTNRYSITYKCEKKLYEIYLKINCTTKAYSMLYKYIKKPIGYCIKN